MKKSCCSFCARDQKDLNRLVAGPGVCICDECIEMCNQILEDELEQEPQQPLKDLLSPRDIFNRLNEYVIGQEDAKKVLSVAVYNHYKRLYASKEFADIEIAKSNVLVIGPTGSGKTLLAQTLARILDVPFTIADATSLTEAGYVGDDVEKIILQLVEAADFDIERAERGIVFIDEIDKITRKSENASITRDVSGEGVQQALLKLIEGTVAAVPPKGGRKHPGEETLKVNTRNILFICGGAFVGLDKIISQRTGSRALGFGSSKEGHNLVPIRQENIVSQVQTEDLLKFGLIPEFVGRLPIVSTLTELSQAELVRILSEPKNALEKQYKKLFELEGIQLEFEPKALQALAKKALKRKTGARGLRALLEELLLDYMYELPSAEDVLGLKITEGVITKGEKPQIRYHTKQKSA